MNEFLSVVRLKKYYGSKGQIVKAVNDISFDVKEGEFIGIMGVSGSGKTTLLNCLSTIDTVTSGNIYLLGKDITSITEKESADYRGKNLGFIFQDFNLLDILTIEENIGLALTVNGQPLDKVNSRVKEVARQLGISEILKKFPYEVSGGQKQRCACARALINQPKLILADEPTGALDSKSAQMLMETIEAMNETLHSTIFMVTHDAFSASYCKRILFMKDGKLFNEIIRGDKSRREFFNEILDVLALLGGDTSYAK